MTLTLTSLLEINTQFVEPDDERALLIAERRWSTRGSPCNPKALCESLEETLRHLTKQGIHYPKILLLRKKQLQRGTWKPEDQPSSGQMCPTPDDGLLCNACDGTGIQINADGTGSFCSCEAAKDLKRGHREYSPSILARIRRLK
jgi:hypothetical protein